MIQGPRAFLFWSIKTLSELNEEHNDAGGILKALLSAQYLLKQICVCANLNITVVWIWNIENFAPCFAWADSGFFVRGGPGPTASKQP